MSKSKRIRIQIQEYNLPDFCNTIVKYAKENYEVCTDNEGYPKHFIGVYECHMTLNEPEEENTQEPLQPVQKPAGRPRKA